MHIVVRTVEELCGVDRLCRKYGVTNCVVLIVSLFCCYRYCGVTGNECLYSLWPLIDSRHRDAIIICVVLVVSRVSYMK